MPEEMKIASIWVVWSFLSMGALGWALWVVLESVGSLKDMAAWVQAIGSIGAILAAIAIARRGLEQQKEDKLFENYEYMQKAFGVAAYAKEVIAGVSEYILEEVSTPAMLKYHSSLLEVSLEDLKEINYSRIEDANVADAFLSLKRSVNLTKSAILAQLEGNVGFDPGQVATWKTHASSEVQRMSDAMIRYLARHPWLLDAVYARHQSDVS